MKLALIIHDAFNSVDQSIRVSVGFEPQPWILGDFLYSFISNVILSTFPANEAFGSKPTLTLKIPQFLKDFQKKLK